MNILFVAAECAPFVKVGGLGDVVGTLPQELHRLGHSVRVVIPHYGLIDDKAHGIRPFEEFTQPWSGSLVNARVSSVERDGVGIYFVSGWPYFGADHLVYNMDAGIDIGRFLFLGAVTFQLINLWSGRSHWRPDVIHVHDWHTALIPFVMSQLHGADPVLGRIATVLSIHNMQYQGWGCGWHLEQAGLPPVDHPLLAAMELSDNSLAIGLAYSTILSTVSPTYAGEIGTEAGGYGLDGLVEARAARLKGVLNGLDVDRWNPATSRVLKAPFSSETLDKRGKNKAALQAELGLAVRADVPLMGTVIRLVDQKGPSILFPAVRAILESRPSQFVLLGAGQPEHEAAARQLQKDFPKRVVSKIGFDEPLSERIYGGSDLFLMPSLFEPCGIGQMIAMRYGSLPVVRRVGGLADTVDAQTGYLVNEHNEGALAGVIGQALDDFEKHPDIWRERQRQGMSRDFSWESSAEKYVGIYDQARSLHYTYAQLGA